MSDRAERASKIVAGLALTWALVSIWAFVDQFAQQRFFTIDEYQYGHATWLVARGELPYVDFYEHHFPLSYVAHAPLLGAEGSFVERALQLRAISFGYLLAMSLVLLASTWWVTRNPFVAALSAGLPLAFGFGLMSQVDYRADNFAACAMVISLALLEANRERASRSIAVAAGVSFAAYRLPTRNEA
jgi:hypothetical protein